MPSIASITDLVKRGAHEAGFDLSGIAPASGAQELAYFPSWIAAGHAGEMKYMEARDDQGLKRASLARAAPWARSVVVCAINYNTAQPYSTQKHDPRRGWISRYAWGREDYHDAVLKKLRGVEKQLTDSVPHAHKRKPRFAIRRAFTRGIPAYLVLRRHRPHRRTVYAKYAGVGWIGKNTCCIEPAARLLALPRRDR